MSTQKIRTLRFKRILAHGRVFLEVAPGRKMWAIASKVFEMKIAWKPGFLTELRMVPQGARKDARGLGAQSAINSSP